MLSGNVGMASGKHLAVLNVLSSSIGTAFAHASSAL